MAQQHLNYSSPNDGLGDTLRTSQVKSESNFTELYSNKVDKITGKSLSDVNFSQVDKDKLDSLDPAAGTQSDWNEGDNTSLAYINNKPENISEFFNDAEYVVDVPVVDNFVRSSNEWISLETALIEAGISQSVLNNNDLFTLKSLVQKIVNGTASTVVFATFGDSMAMTKSQFLFPYLEKYTGFSGAVGFGNYKGVTRNTGSAVTTQLDYTLFPFTMIQLASGAAGIYGIGGANATADKWKIYYINNGATFKVQIDDIDNTTVTTTTDGTVGILTITTSVAAHKFSVVNLTGTTLLPGVGMYNSTIGGLIPVYFNEGGNDMSDWISNTLALNNLFAIYADMGVNVFSYEMKELVSGLQSRITTLFDKIQSSLPNSDVLIYTTTPITSDTGGTMQANNSILRQEAFNRKFSLFDCFKKIGSYETLVKLGWQGDGTHPTSDAQKYLAKEVLKDFGLINFFKAISLDARVEFSKADKFASFNNLEIYGDSAGFDGNIKVPRKLFFRNFNGTKIFSLDLGDGTNGSDGTTSVLPDIIQFGANNQKLRGTTSELWINTPTGGGASLGNLRLSRLYASEIRSSPADLLFYNSSSVVYAAYFTSGRVAFQNGGTFTDDGVNRLQVNGTIKASPATLTDQVVIKSQLDLKQDALVSGTNIKTVGGVSLLGSGNITEVQNSLTASTILSPSVTAVNTAIALKADLVSPALTGTPTAPTAAAGTNTTQLATTAFVQSATRPYKSYAAIISQSGTSAPTVVGVLENQLSGAIVWTRSSAGVYNGTLTGAFAAVKVLCFSQSGSYHITPQEIFSYRGDANTIILATNMSGTATDGLLTNAQIEVRVYN